MTPDRSWQGWISIITATKSKKNVYDNILDPCGDLYIQSEKITDHLTDSAEGKARCSLHIWVGIETQKDVMHCLTYNITCLCCVNIYFIHILIWRIWMNQHQNEINGNTTRTSYIACCKMHNILLGIHHNPHMKAAPCLPFSWIWKEVNYFVWLEVNVPMSGQVIVDNIHFLWGCGGSDSDSSLFYSFWCHCWHRARWGQVRLSFSYRIWDIWLNFKFLCTVFFCIRPFTCYCLSKSWWDNLCVLGVPCILWMNV